MPRKIKQQPTYVQIEARTAETVEVHCPLDFSSYTMHVSGRWRNSTGVFAETLLRQTRKLDIADRIVAAVLSGDLREGDDELAVMLANQYQKLPRT